MKESLWGDLSKLATCRNCKEVVNTAEAIVDLAKNQYICPHCRYPMNSETPKSEVVCPGIDQIPFEGLEAIGEIFAEGEVKYGRDNWKKDTNNIPYEQERTRHAIRHLWLWANGDRSENHLAKVAWFCVTQIWREKQRI